jgi:hypothetical protein
VKRGECVRAKKPHTSISIHDRRGSSVAGLQLFFLEARNSNVGVVAQPLLHLAEAPVSFCTTVEGVRRPPPRCFGISRRIK